MERLSRQGDQRRIVVLVAPWQVSAVAAQLVEVQPTIAVALVQLTHLMARPVRAKEARRSVRCPARRFEVARVTLPLDPTSTELELRF